MSKSIFSKLSSLKKRHKAHYSINSMENFKKFGVENNLNSDYMLSQYRKLTSLRELSKILDLRYFDIAHVIEDLRKNKLNEDSNIKVYKECSNIDVLDHFVEVPCDILLTDRAVAWVIYTFYKEDLHSEPKYLSSNLFERIFFSL